MPCSPSMSKLANTTLRRVPSAKSLALSCPTSPTRSIPRSSSSVTLMEVKAFADALKEDDVAFYRLPSSDQPREYTLKDGEIVEKHRSIPLSFSSSTLTDRDRDVSLDAWLNNGGRSTVRSRPGTAGSVSSSTSTTPRLGSVRPRTPVLHDSPPMLAASFVALPPLSFVPEEETELAQELERRLLAVMGPS